MKQCAAVFMLGGGAPSCWFLSGQNPAEFFMLPNQADSKLLQKVTRRDEGLPADTKSKTPEVLSVDGTNGKLYFITVKHLRHKLAYGADHEVLPAG